MASSRFILAFLLLCVLAIHLVDSHQLLESQELASKSSEGSIAASPPVITPLDCGVACTSRCSKSSRPNLCKRACGTCCTRCKCVPAGTYGNYDTCACYATMMTRGGVRKCP